MNLPLLISIHPEFVEKILSGQKVFEFRKILPSKLPSHLVIYATNPVQKVVAVAEVEGAMSGSPSEIWERTGKGAGISRAYFRQYFSGRKTANAFQLGKVFELKIGIPLAEINPKLVAPQSFLFLQNTDFSWVQAQIDNQPCTPSRFIFLGGVHGVGKSTLCKNVFSPMGYACATASSIIKAAGGSVVTDKTVKNVDSNQDLLLRSLPLVLKQYARFVLDGHFTLVDAKGHIEPIPIDVFRRINPNALVLLIGNPTEIARRLSARDDKKWSQSFIAEFQNTEIHHAEEIANALDVPLHLVRNDDNPSKLSSRIQEAWEK
jgi:adenylate kinase